MINIVISGYYGNLNTGDEAILKVLVDKIKEMDEHDIDITVLSSRPESTSKNYNVHSVNRKSIMSVLKAIKRCDILISGGGSLFQNETSNRSLYYYIFQIIVAKLFGKKIFVFSQGIGPIKNRINWILFVKIVNLCDIITVRDYDSYKLLLENKINKDLELSADPAFLLEPSAESKTFNLFEKENIDINNNKKTVGIIVRKWKIEDGMNYKIAQFADYLIDSKEINVIFIPFQGKWDILKINEIVNLMKNKPFIIKNVYQPEDMLALFNKIDLIIGMRLHALIFAAKLNKKFIGITYDPKINSFLNIYNQKPIGTIFDFSVENLINKTNEILADDNILNIQKRINYQQIQKANVSFNKLKKLLKEIKKDKSIYIFGVRIDTVNFNLALKKIEQTIINNKKMVIFTPNVEMIMLSQKDIQFMKVLNNGDLNVPDGIGVIWASKYFGQKLYERVAGFDLLIKMLPLLKKYYQRVFLLGAKEGIATKAAENLIKNYGINIVGTHNGYFDFENDENLIEIINKTNCDVLFVALGMKKQELWIYKNKDKLNAKIIMGVGGSFDVLAGNVKRAPLIYQKLGIEWLYRLIQEPWRYKRMLVLPKFALKVIRSNIWRKKS
ncbi:polysaccharide pyruvyl transferase CsaB [Caldicellulosiruptoraceae bacterium PP1]